MLDEIINSINIMSRSRRLSSFRDSIFTYEEDQYFQSPRVSRAIISPWIKKRSTKENLRISTQRKQSNKQIDLFLENVKISNTNHISHKNRSSLIISEEKNSNQTHIKTEPSYQSNNKHQKQDDFTFITYPQQPNKNHTKKCERNSFRVTKVNLSENNTAGNTVGFENQPKKIISLRQKIYPLNIFHRKWKSKQLKKLRVTEKKMSENKDTLSYYFQNLQELAMNSKSEINCNLAKMLKTNREAYLRIGIVHNHPAQKLNTTHIVKFKKSHGFSLGKTSSNYY